MKKIILFIGIAFHSLSILGNIDSLLLLLNSSAQDTSTIKILREIGDAYFENNPDKAIDYYDQALKLTEKNEMPLEAALCYINAGQCFAQINKYKKSLENYFNAIQIYKQIDDKDGIANCYNYMGNSYSLLNSNAKALEYNIKSLSLYKELNDKDGISIVLIDIGNIYYDQKDYSKARSYYSESLNICKELDDSSGVSTCYINLGNIFSDSGDLDKGIEYYQKALKIENENGSDDVIASIYNNIGDTYLMQGKYDISLEYLLKAKKISNSSDDKELNCILDLNISSIKLKQEKYAEAINYATNSLKLAQQVGILSYQSENYQNLTSIYRNQEDYQNALKYHQLYKQINDSIYNVDKQMRFEELDAIYHLERNQQQIANLTKDSEYKEKQLGYQRQVIAGLLLGGIIFFILAFLLYRQQKAKSKALKMLSEQKEEIQVMHDEMETQRDYLDELNATKDKFFSIIAHDLKNPFNSIVGFSDLMIENFQEHAPEDNKRFLKMIKNSSSQALNLLQNLLMWAHSQTGSIDFQPKLINLKDRFNDTLALIEIQAAKKNIKIEAICNDNCIIQADSNMLDTILRNLLSNAVKYTNQNGKIVISTTEKSNYCIISIKDNGIGISEENIQNLFQLESKFSHIGTANEQGSGLGLILCKDFVNRHGGKIRVKSKPGKGSEFIFTMPKG